MIDTPVGPALPSTHLYNERFDRHGINPQYVEELLADTHEWERSGGRIVARSKRDGVVWEIVLQRERDGHLEHEWDVITVIPAEVDRKKAAESEMFDEVDALNLALYSD